MTPRAALPEYSKCVPACFLSYDLHSRRLACRSRRQPAPSTQTRLRLAAPGSPAALTPMTFLLLTSKFEAEAPDPVALATYIALRCPIRRPPRLFPPGVDIAGAVVDWLGAPNPPAPKYSDYSYYHEWQASVELRLSDGSAGRRLIGMAPDLERFFGRVITSMRTTT